MEAMDLQSMQEKQQQARTAMTHYSELIIEYVETSTFTGKELLDMIKRKQDEPEFETEPYKMFAGILMEIIKEKESIGTVPNQI